MMYEEVNNITPPNNSDQSFKNVESIQENLLDVVEDVDFNFDGYQVVRGEYFAHLYEPSITFNLNKVYLNAASIRKLPNIDYVQILVNSEEKKIAVRPCAEDIKDSFLWCTPKRKPKQITCRVFFGKIISLMDWNPDYRYKLLGKLIKSNDEYLFTFDSNAPEIYTRTLVEGAKPKTSRTPVFPEQWQNQFGLPVAEHTKRMQVNIFNGYTVFGIKDKQEKNKNVGMNGELNYEQ